MNMSTRSTESTVSFSQPFCLSQFDQPQAAGSYQLVTDEEPLEGLSFTAYHRVRTLLYLPANGRPGHARQVVEIDPAELAAAIVADALRNFGTRGAPPASADHD
jgi:hypothetical protein